jgi:hypothetical protein
MSMRLQHLADLRVAPPAVVLWRRLIGLAAIIKAVLLTGPLADLGGVSPRLATIPLPADLWLVPLLLIAGGGLCLVAHRLVRGGGIAIAVGGLFAVLADERLYSNHLWLLVLLVALTALTKAPAERRGEGLPYGHLVLVQISVVYGFAAVSKLNLAFISGGVLWADLTAEGALVPLPELVVTRQRPLMALALATVVIELVLAVGLWVPWVRRGAAVLGVFFHLGLVALVPGWEELLVFALLCWSTYPLFLTRDSSAVVAAAHPTAHAIARRAS